METEREKERREEPTQKRERERREKRETVRHQDWIESHRIETAFMDGLFMYGLCFILGSLYLMCQERE